MIIVRILADPEGFDRALDSRGRRWGPFINLRAEYVELRNNLSRPQDISGWRLQDLAGHRYVFPPGTAVQPGATIRVRTGEGQDSATDLFWNRRMPVWNNRGDTAFLYDSEGNLVHERSLSMEAPAMPTITLPRFRAETDPVGPAINIFWDLPDPTGDPLAIPIRLLRRERRFPGRNRRGVVPVNASLEDLLDGDLVYDNEAFEYDVEERREEQVPDGLVSTTCYFFYRGSPRDRVLVRSVKREYPRGGGPPRRTAVRIVDRAGLAAGTVYYYTAFVGPQRVYNRLTQASAIATDRYNHALFQSLPLVHQRLDTVTPAPFTVSNDDLDKGQLERFVGVFDAHADMLHGFLDGLRDLHNPRRADSRVLGPLARLIGWHLKDYLDEDSRRNEIMFAPEVYRTVGTIPNIVAMINRLTGWDARVREFAKNVAVTFDAERLEQLESQTVYLDGSLTPSESPPPHLTGRFLPQGTVDTTDPTAMFKLRTRAFDDDTAYTFDCGRPDGHGGYVKDNDVWYNRQTIGIYIVPDVESETFELLEQWERVHQILSEFLPIQVRAVFVLLPSVVVEEPYDATEMVGEESLDVGVEFKDET